MLHDYYFYNKKRSEFVSRSRERRLNDREVVKHRIGSLRLAGETADSRESVRNREIVRYQRIGMIFGEEWLSSGTNKNW